MCSSGSQSIQESLLKHLEAKSLSDLAQEKETLQRNKPALLQYVSRSVIGDRLMFHTPFGERPIVYADYTASGRSLEFIEKYIHDMVLPSYANTHTSTSWVGRQTSYFRHEARDIIHRSVNAGDDDIVLFTGSGSTSAIFKMVEVLRKADWGKRLSYFQRNRWGSFDCTLCNMSFATQGKYHSHVCSMIHQDKLSEIPKLGDKNVKPVIFLSVYEHHSNLLPWRETGADVVQIPETEHGELDLQYLAAKLEEHKENPYKIGTFSAASNITGVLVDTRAIARLLHSYGAIAMFDFAAAAPYVKIDMNYDSESYYDAIFISTHKFLGGPGSPGILVVKKWLLGNEIPTIPGGGTVFYVTEKDHQYLLNAEEREEGGTPDIIGSIRAGLVFQLKETIGEEFIEEKEIELTKKIMKRLRENPNIMILGPREDMTRLPVFSILIRCGGRFLHHSFIAALLNDLFGVEVRAGCACAGPYAFHTMGIDYQLAKKLEDILSDGYDLFRPGFVRVNFNYFIDDYTLEYILQCIDFVATHGLWFLPQYKFDIQKAAFIHRDYSTKGERHSDRKWLGDISYSTGEMKYPPCCITKDFELTKHLTTAQSILESIQSSRYSNLDLVDSRIEIPYQYEKYRSFILPSEALAYIQGREDSITYSVSPYYPCTYDDTATSPVLPLITNPEDSRKNQTLDPISIPKKLIKKVTNAISEFNMINEGDKILVCISGGKDSLTLLHVLKHISLLSKTRFTIGAATVDPMTPEYDPSPLKAYLAELNIPYFYEAQPLIDLAAEKLTNKKSICSFCSRMKRGILYSCARREGYNVLALGQHLDDLAESFVMSVFNNGKLKTMKANYNIKQGDLRVIRPLVYVRERFTKEFAEKSRLPVIYESCPACFASPQERHRVKLLLASQEQLIPDLFSSILKALKTPVAGSRFSLMSCPVETESVDNTCI